MLFGTGAIKIKNQRALVERASLLAPELELDIPHLDQFEATLTEDLSTKEMRAWLNAAQSPVALRLMKRFSEGEGDASDHGLKGLGRMTSKSFPRLGGVLHDEVRKSGVEPADVVNAVERTVQASFLAMLVQYPDILDRKRLDDESDIWEQWIPDAYVVPEQLLERIWEICAVGAFWTRTFECWGLKKATKQFKKFGTAVNSSIGGLAGVGIALAIAEREPG